MPGESRRGRQPTKQALTLRERMALVEAGKDPGPAGDDEPQQKKPYDPTRAPEGYHQDYWGMAVLFLDLALKDDINLRAGRPVIYTEIKQMFEWFDLENGSRPYQTRGDGHVELTYRQMYRDGEGKPQTWVEVGYAIIEEFWDRYWDDAALQHFCDLDVFMEVAEYVVRKWEGKRIRAQIAARPKPPPEPMTWNREGHRRIRRIAK